jgi:hypothetical protein
LQEIAVFKDKMKMEASQGLGPSQGSQQFRGKKSIKFYKPSVAEFNNAYYLIASDVFLLGGKPRKLTPEDIQELPVIISWKGPDYHYKTDEKECFQLLCKIIFDMNLMQNPKFVSFPLGMVFFYHFTFFLLFISFPFTLFPKASFGTVLSTPIEAGLCTALGDKTQSRDL